MKLAIAVEKGMVSGPGEAEEIRIYDTENSQQLESYPNPALTANSARGILMLKSIVDRGVTSVIVSGIGAHAFSYTTGRIKLFKGEGLSVEEALKSFINGNMTELSVATH